MVNEWFYFDLDLNQSTALIWQRRRVACFSGKCYLYKPIFTIENLKSQFLIELHY